MKTAQSCIAGLLIITSIAFIFGYWFATMQINAVHTAGFVSYPKLFFYITVLKCMSTILAIYIINAWVFMLMANCNSPLNLIALTFIPLITVVIGISILTITILILSLQLLLLISCVRKDKYNHFKATYLFDGLILLLLIGLHFFLTTRYSPIKFDEALLAPAGFYTAEVAVLAPLFKGYVAAKQFAFSYVDHAQWAGIMNPPVTLASPLLQLLTFIMDLPSISYEHFQKIFMFLHFILFVVGSFGFYLFLKYAAKLSLLFCIFGGYLFGFGGAPLLGLMLGEDCAVFLSCYAVFPYALLFISLAFEKNKMLYAASAGAALAAQFFIYTPHPEGVIYSLFCFMVFAFCLQFFAKQLNIKRRIALSLMAMGSFFALIAHALIPILIDRWSGNMYVFAHTGDIAPAPLHLLQIYGVILECAIPIALTLQLYKQKIDKIFVSSLALALSTTTFIFLTAEPATMSWLVDKFHVGFHFWYIWRIGLFFYLATLIISLFAMQALRDVIVKFIKTAQPHLGQAWLAKK